MTQDFCFCEECGEKMTYQHDYLGRDALRCPGCGTIWSAKECLEMEIEDE
jgi:tRNA(Ile2) C34 agmatinyltransferase TiaS